MKKIFIIMLCFFLFGCSAPEKSVVKKINNEYSYRFFYVEEMPCMHIALGEEDAMLWSYGGITCDWSKWSGNK